jgi:hypothetical protein
MKIAILTLPVYSNYGGILQCYALQSILERMGHEVKVLKKPTFSRTYYIIYPLAICKRLFKRFVLNQKIAILKAPHQIVRQHTNRFIHQYLNLYIKKTWTTKIASHFDAIIVGSDQIWRPAYSKPIEQAFLSFLDGCNIKRIAYAASFGVDDCQEYTFEQLQECSRLLKMFNAISVREASGVKICQDYFGVKAVQMLDPTLLLSIDNYRTLIKNGNTHPSKGNMLVYMLDRTEEKDVLVNQIAKETGLIPFWITNEEENISLPLEQRIKQPVEQWLRSFDDAEFVLTDSFHGCVFSILFKKTFIVWGNNQRGITRFVSLLQLFNLKSRLINSLKDFFINKEGLLKHIDYSIITAELLKYRELSISFLKNTLTQ